MKINKIVIIEHESLSYRKKENYLINEFIDKGYNIEYWDCSQFFFPGINLGDTLCEDYCFTINSLNDLSSNLSRINVEETIFIVEVFYKWNNRKFFKFLKDNGCCLVKIEMYATANVAYLSVWDKLKQMSIKQLCNICKNRILNNFFNLYCKFFDIKYDIIIGSGTYKNVDFHINHPDWELYKKIKDDNSTCNSQYAVFLDEYFPLHPDLKYYHNFYLSCEEKYRSSLNKYFKLLEESLNLKVIIAAHPKSSYDDKAFEGRLIIKNNTVSLVKDAQVVIMHSSAALAFAIMFNKPIIFIATNDYLRAKELKKYQISITKFVNKQIHNIDDSMVFDERYLSHIDLHNRHNYIYNYLTTEKTQNRNNIDILNDIFRSL